MRLEPHREGSSWGSRLQIPKVAPPVPIVPWSRFPPSHRKGAAVPPRRRPFAPSSGCRHRPVLRPTHPHRKTVGAACHAPVRAASISSGGAATCGFHGCAGRARARGERSTRPPVDGGCGGRRRSTGYVLSARRDAPSVPPRPRGCIERREQLQPRSRWRWCARRGARLHSQCVENELQGPGHP